MKTPTENQKKIYLVVGMSVLGTILLITLNAFKAKDNDPSDGQSDSIVSPNADFNITLDTLDNKDRSAFYTKQREEDSIPLIDPFDKGNPQESGSKILTLTNELENPTPPKPKTKIKVDDSLWDMDSEEEPSNLGIGLSKPVETEAERRQRILEANRRQSELYSPTAPASNTEYKIGAAVYRNQWILPNDEVELILTEDMDYSGKIIPKNSVFKGVASIDQNRVNLKVSSINGVPVNLIVKDAETEIIGIKSKRAGELWNEGKRIVENNLVQEVTLEASQETGRIGRGIGRAINQIFRRKNLKQTDKIFLTNDYPVLLTKPTN
ncbi:MAG: conjugative transposon protein TraM [Bacteroidota bacterium]